MPDINWVIQSVIMLALGIIGYFIKDLKKSIQEEITENKRRIDETNVRLEEFREEFKEYKVEQAREISGQFKDYVSKSEFVRVTANYERKIDKIYDILMEIKSTVNTRRADNGRFANGKEQDVPGTGD